MKKIALLQLFLSVILLVSNRAMAERPQSIYLPPPTIYDIAKSMAPKLGYNLEMMCGVVEQMDTDGNAVLSGDSLVWIPIVGGTYRYDDITRNYRDAYSDHKVHVVAQAIPGTPQTNAGMKAMWKSDLHESVCTITSHYVTLVNTGRGVWASYFYTVIATAYGTPFLAPAWQYGR